MTFNFGHMLGKVAKRAIIWGVALVFGQAQKALPPDVATMTIGGVIEAAANYIKVRFSGKW